MLNCLPRQLFFDNHMASSQKDLIRPLHWYDDKTMGRQTEDTTPTSLPPFQNSYPFSRSS